MKTKVLFSALVFSVTTVWATETRLQEAPDASTSAQTEQVRLQPDKMPEYVGGMSALMAFLAENIHYPADAVKAQKEGRVLCSFVITEEGKVTDVRVARSGGMQSLDDEAVRVVRSMPDWIPGRDENDEPVKVQFSIPIMFSLNLK